MPALETPTKAHPLPETERTTDTAETKDAVSVNATALALQASLPQIMDNCNNVRTNAIRATR